MNIVCKGFSIVVAYGQVNRNTMSRLYRVSQNYPNILFSRPKGRAKQFYISSLLSSVVNLISNIVAHSVRQIPFQNHREIERNVKLRLVG